MSGGSWDYAYCKMDEIAQKLLQSDKVERRVFGKKMVLFSHAMHEIEWVDSDDSSSPDDTNAIAKAIGKEMPKLIMAELIEEAKESVKKLEFYIDKATIVKNE